MNGYNTPPNSEIFQKDPLLQVKSLETVYKKKITRFVIVHNAVVVLIGCFCGIFGFRKFLRISKALFLGFNLPPI